MPVLSLERDFYPTECGQEHSVELALSMEMPQLNQDANMGGQSD
jgi:hypothetical protein